MPCTRHSYPKGHAPGSGRQCRNCGHYDGVRGLTETTASSPPISTSIGALTLVRPSASRIDGVREGSPIVVIETAATTSALLASTNVIATLPEHSALGASSAERWMNCSGSVALIHALKTADGYVEDDPDYRRDGVSAHALAAYCLENDVDCWEAPLEGFPGLTEDMMSAVQTYLDFTRSLPGRSRYVETRVHRPEFHPLFYGTLDFAAIHVTED